MTDQPHRPLACRLHIRHRWVPRLTSDGGRYQQCRRCGKDRTEVDYNDWNDGNKAINAGMIGLGGMGGGGF